MREKYTGAFFNIERKHLVWKPSNLRSSAFVKHPVESAYSSLDSIRALRISSFLRRDEAADLADCSKICPRDANPPVQLRRGEGRGQIHQSVRWFDFVFVVQVERLPAIDLE